MDYSKKLTVLKHEYLENRRVLSDFQWGLSAIEIPDNITIKNNDVVVAVIDSGIDLNHNDLKNNIWTNPFEKADGIDILSKYRIKGWATDITNSNKRLLIQVTINDIHNYSRKANMLRSDIGGAVWF